MKLVKPEDTLESIRKKLQRRYGLPSNHFHLQFQKKVDDQVYSQKTENKRTIVFISFALKEELLMVLKDKNDEFFMNYYGIYNYLV